jgi:dTDP-glucose pyrophosphorylase
MTIAPEVWRTALVSMDATLQDVIRNLDETALQIAIVIDGDGRLVGTLTDGDIRRGLLRGLSLSSSIEPMIWREPLVAPPELPRDVVLQLMQVNKVHQLPVVDESRHVVGLHVWDDLMVPSARTNTMVIMAGGRGTRLLPHTEQCPKPMLPIGGKPMLEHIIERARAEGFTHFVLAVHHLAHMIDAHFGDGARWGVSIADLRETAPLGTAGAIGLLAPAPAEPFVVSNGDVLTDVRYAELLDFHVRHGAVATMAVRQHEWQHPFGVVRTRGVDIVGYDEKPVTRTHINAGIYVLDPSALAALTPGEPCDMPALFSRLQADGARTIVYPMHEPWLDVGRAADLARAREDERSNS